jgi:hypothetical protein
MQTYASYALTSYNVCPSPLHARSTLATEKLLLNVPAAFHAAVLQTTVEFSTLILKR